MKAGLKAHLLTHPLVYKEDLISSSKFSSHGQYHYSAPLIRITHALSVVFRPLGLHNKFA